MTTRNFSAEALDESPQATKSVRSSRSIVTLLPAKNGLAEANRHAGWMGKTETTTVLTVVDSAENKKAQYLLRFFIADSTSSAYVFWNMRVRWSKFQAFSRSVNIGLIMFENELELSDKFAFEILDAIHIIAIFTAKLKL